MAAIKTKKVKRKGEGMKKKKFTALLLTASLAITGLAACGTQSASTDETEIKVAEEKGSASLETLDVSGTVRYLTANDTTGTTEELVALFNEEYPNVTVEIEYVPGASDDIKQSLATSLAAGDSTPDVFSCDIIWVSQFAAAGWLYDVTDELEPIADQYLAGPLQSAYYNGTAYAFPNYTDVGLLYYRSDIIETPPTTWDELVADCEEYIGTNGIENGYLFQMFQGEPTSCNMLEFIKQNGGQDLVDGAFAINSENSVEALEFVESLIENGYAPEGVLTHKPADSRALFEQGTSLFMRNWTNAYVLTQTEDGTQVEGKVGVAALPVGPNGESSSGTLGGWNYAVNANTENPDAAIAFAKFLSSYEAQKISTLKTGTFPTLSAVYEDADVLEQQPYIADVRDAADAAEPRPQVTDYSAISTLFQEWFHKALLGEISNEEALENLNEALNEKLAEFNN
jgi:multiple sugar transport system substrate-binding protein